MTRAWGRWPSANSVRPFANGIPHPHRTLQVVFNLVPLSSWKAYLPVIDSFQIDRYPCGAGMPYFGQQGDWGLLIMAWSMAHGASALEEFLHLRNPLALHAGGRIKPPGRAHSGALAGSSA